MCTCITYDNGDFYFGRNLDLDTGFGERVVITPRDFPLSFNDMPAQDHHYAMIGMASSENSYPLYAEAVNEKGLCAAGLNFPKSASYKERILGKDNIAPYEIIPWILGQCGNMKEVKALIKNINITDIPFSEDMPNAPLHWIVADRECSIVIEAVKEGIKIYDNPYGILTNEPEFSYYKHHLSLYGNLSSASHCNGFFKNGDSDKNLSDKTPKLDNYAEGLGAVGLPGDFSPVSRFVKAAFLKWNSISEKDEVSDVSQFFHILDSVAMVSGAVITQNNKEDITIYSCCINARKGVYYYKTYKNSRIQAVDLYKEDLDGDNLKTFELIKGQDINFINRHNVI